MDERCRAAEGVWAIGDVTGVMLFTHVGMYRAASLARTSPGGPRAPTTRLSPGVFSDPEIAGRADPPTRPGSAASRVLTSRVEPADAIARPWTYEREPRGSLGLVADARERVVVGAWAVAPLASEWIHQVALAIKCRIGLDVLRDTVAQFPTFSEAVMKGARLWRRHDLESAWRVRATNLARESCSG